MSAARKPNVGRLLRDAAAAQANNHHDLALRHAREVLACYPGNPQALLIAGQSYLMLEEPDQALMVLNRLVEIQPDSAIVLNNRGVALDLVGQFDRALLDYRHARNLEPSYEDALINEAQCLQRLGRFLEAVTAYDSILKLAPIQPAAQLGKAQALRQAGQVEKALQALTTLSTSQPHDAAIWSALGDAHLDARQWQQAVDAYGQASTLRPNDPLTYANCGKALRELNQLEDALLVTDAALSIDPSCIAARRNRVVFLLDLSRWSLAIEACLELLKRLPSDATAYNNLGFALNALKQYEAALDAFDKATQLDPNMAIAWVNKACTLEFMHRHQEALSACEQALELDPTYPNLAGRLGHARLYLCDWQHADHDRARVIEATNQGLPACDPFRIISFSDQAAHQQALARSWLKSRPPTWTPEAWPDIRAQRHEGRIRVGYFSADFHHHATTLLMAQMLELHDKSRFEVIGISFGPPREDAMRQRLRKAFDSFHDVMAMDDDKAAMLARSLNLDIAIDLKGHTLDNRIDIFRRRVAPVQISYLGFPGTLGGPFMDYILADQMLIPDPLRHYYDEKVIRIPGTYQANDASRSTPQTPPNRGNLGLPNDGFVFCCFNNNYKITPEIFDIWMRLLRNTPGSVLWLLADNETASANLRHEASARGVDPSRVIFAPRVSWEEHLARQRAADLFLDTTPCNAHTTASDALRVGLPVLTCTGTAFASRVAASLLHAQGLDELITADLSSYEVLAQELARSPQRMSALRLKCEAAIETGLMLNSLAHVRAIESAYEAVVNRAWDGKAPDHIDVY